MTCLWLQLLLLLAVSLTLEGFVLTLPLSARSVLKQHLRDDGHHRIDIIDPDPGQAIAEEARKNSAPRVRRYYETFLWKKNVFTAEDYMINYRVEGPADGPPILLIHGFGANANHFRFQFPVLVKEGYRVYAVDLLGFGGSDKPKDANYSIELFVKLLEDFVVAMDPTKKWIAAGNSVGGLCSLGLADRLAEKILAVVLFNTSGGMSYFRYNQIPLLLRPIVWVVQKFVLRNPVRGGQFFERFKTRENVESILMTQGVYGNTKNVDEELLEILLGPADDEGARDVFLKVFGGDPGPTPESFLARIECPVLALWGEADPWTVVAMGEAFGKHAKHYKLERLPGAGHCPHDEAPELVHEIMLPWLKDVLNSQQTSKSQGQEAQGQASQ
jgi:pimeloyl-ACP methyl ester carboxylesterase